VFWRLLIELIGVESYLFLYIVHMHLRSRVVLPVNAVGLGSSHERLHTINFLFDPTQVSATSFSIWWGFDPRTVQPVASLYTN